MKIKKGDTVLVVAGKARGKIIEKESPIHVSNVMYYCSRCSDGVKLGAKRTDSGRLRVCRSCGTEFE
jgi:large subunit ribosomal protein L24